MVTANARDTDHCIAGVLVGGRSRRMGVDKTGMRLPNGTTFVEHVCKVAAKAANEVVLLGECASPPPGITCVLPDLMPDGGPMIGLYSLLGYAKDRWALLLACDMPLLTSPTLVRLLAAPSKGEVVAFSRADVAGLPRTAKDSHDKCTQSQPGLNLHTCCALYHPRLLPLVRTLVESGERTLHALTRQAAVATLTPTPEEARSLANVNTLGDLEQLGLAAKAMSDY